MKLPHRKATQSILVLPVPRLTTGRLNVKGEHFPVPGNGHPLASRAMRPDVLPAVQAPARIKTRSGETRAAAPAKLPHPAVSQPLRPLPGPPSLSWNTRGRRVHLPSPGSCGSCANTANTGYLSLVGGRRTGCRQEAAWVARYVAVLGRGERSRDCGFSPRIRNRRGPTSAQRGTADHGGHTAFAHLKACP